MLVANFIMNANSFLWGWPLILLTLGAALLTTVALGFVQFRFFGTAWRLLIFPASKTATGDMSPLQAFINALSASIGNGSLAGVATAIYAGGPGAALWIFIFGLLAMALRFAEVFLATNVAPLRQAAGTIGGPMIYLEELPGGKALSLVYACFLVFLGFTGGSSMQANSIRIGLVRLLGISPWLVAMSLFALVAYIVAGGAQRIVHVSDRIVPIKVGLFFISALIVLCYHAHAIPHALQLIWVSAFYPQAIFGAGAGIMIQRAMRFGVARAVNSSEAGIGTAAVLFGGTASTDSVKNGIMSMISVFISANLVCFLVALIIIVSGVWNNGQTSIDLTISAYETVFGSFGAGVVTFLSIAFGVGVLVAYAYMARASWLFITKGKWAIVFNMLFALATFVGAVTDVEVIWNATDLANGGLLVINLCGIVWLLPSIRRGLQKK